MVWKIPAGQNSSSSFHLSNDKQYTEMQNFLSRWLFQDSSKKVCDSSFADSLRLPVLMSDVGRSFEVVKASVNSLAVNGGKVFVDPGPTTKTNYPNTIIHVIMGQKESTDGFGNWILASNLEWYNAITAKSKERLIRPTMAHTYSYEDMRRFLKLGSNEKPDRTLEQCKTGTRESNGNQVQFSCGCGTIQDGVLQADGCFYKGKMVDKIPEGLFKVGVDIGYSNGGGYCLFDTMANFTKLSGRGNAEGVTNYDTLPSGMENQGVCRGK